MLKIGDRVWGRRPPEDYWYPGTIRHSVGDRFYVIFDDGEDALLPPEHLRPLRLEVGDMVYARRSAASEFESAQVADKTEDKLLLTYEDGQQLWTDWKAIRLRPGVRRAAPAPQPQPQWEVCDRVLACWFDLDWYPGIVLAAEEDRIHVLLDNGSQAPLAPARVRPFQLTVGERVLCRWRGGPDYYAGEIMQIEGEKVLIHYDDGDEEWTSVRLLRLQRDDWLPGGSRSRQVGERILAQWFDGYWYPGLVLFVEGKRLHIAFFDGDQALVTPNQVQDLTVTVGETIYSRKRGEPQYLPAEVLQVEEDRLLVRYDDGEEEWTNWRMVRLER